MPDYDITFAKQAVYEKRRLYNVPPYADFNQLSVTSGEDIYFIGTPEYLKLFFECTKCLSNRKIIYYMKKDLPIIMPVPDNSFVYRRYVPESDIRTNWHYSLAKDFVNGNIP